MKKTASAFKKKKKKNTPSGENPPNILAVQLSDWENKLILLSRTTWMEGNFKA